MNIELYIHTAVVPHICIYSSGPCTNVHVPKLIIYLVYKQIQTAILYQYIPGIYVLLYYIATHIARVWINRVRLPVLHVAS